MSYVLASTLRMDCARAMNNSVSLTSLVEVIERSPSASFFIFSAAV